MRGVFAHCCRRFIDAGVSKDCRLRRAGPAANCAPALKDEARDQARRSSSRPLADPLADSWAISTSPTQRLPSKSHGSRPPFARDCQHMSAQK